MVLEAMIICETVCSTETGLMRSTDMRTRCSRDKDGRDGGSDEKKKQHTKASRMKVRVFFCFLFFFSPLVNHLFHSECRPSAARNHQEPDFCRPPTICFFFFLVFLKLPFFPRQIKSIGLMICQPMCSASASWEQLPIDGGKNLTFFLTLFLCLPPICCH